MHAFFSQRAIPACLGAPRSFSPPQSLSTYFEFMRRLFIVLCIFLLKFSKGNEAEVGFSPVDRWYEVYLGEAKVGYAHDRMALEKDRVLSQNTFVMKLKRAGQTLEVRSTQETIEKPSGELVEFSTEMKMAGIPITKQGRVEGDELVIREKQFIQAKESRYPFDKRGRMSWGIRREFIQQGFKEAGREYSLLVYSPDMGMKSPTRAKVRCHGKKVFRQGEQTITGYELDLELSGLLGSIKSKSWFDEDGVAVGTRMSMGGMQITLIQVPEKRAKTMNAKVPEALLDSVVSLGQEISAKSRRTVFVLEPIKGEFITKLHQGPQQKVKVIEGGAFEVEVFSDPSTLGENSKASPDMAEFLSTNVYLDSSDPLIGDLAEKAKGKKKEIAEIAKSLTTFVHGYVDSKNFSVGFASASEVARSREGDCTEHSILLAAMGRAVGVPSRVATGLVYAKRFQGQRDVLVYHMWTQFFVDGKWINYDSALGYEACPADRILFAVSSLNGEDLIESMLPVMEFIQNLKVRLKSSQ